MSMIGKTLGMFECTALLGKGGMGEVYKAKDQKLGRDVAIKVLPEEFAQDTDRVARFQREAKLLASLNHPNIAAIHGLEESDGIHFLVLELIEGDTLADRLKRGAIPVEESLKLALQIAEALEAAHEKGVIHRDLKPANIKVTPDGKVKVLDFGLAKAFAGEQGDINLSNSPTLSAAATQHGIILGTAAYMSPEQASGETTDKRADIWAFGVVLYEMLTGRSLFAGDNVSQTLARVLEREPDFSALPPNLHFRIRLLLERCLNKEPKNRYSGISDVRVDVQEVLADPSGVFAPHVMITKPRKQLRLSLPWVAAAIALAAIIAAMISWDLKPSDPRQVHRFDYVLPGDQDFDNYDTPAVAVSADGTKIVYVANGQLYLKNSDELTAEPIEGTDEEAATPFFAPDGQWVGYSSLADGQLKKISINGGLPTTLCRVNYPLGATWGTDDQIVFGDRGGVKRVSANGGTPEEIVKGESNQSFMGPQILPDGKSVLFAIATPSGGRVAVQSLESGERKELFPGGPAQYVSTGHIVYGVENSLSAVPFDYDTLEVTGGHVPLVREVFRALPDTPTLSTISSSGTLVYVPGNTILSSAGESKLVWVDREGKEEPLGVDPKLYASLRMSPNGAKIAFAIRNGNKSDIWIWDIAGKNMQPLTLDGTGDNPLWTPDGKRIVFARENEEGVTIYSKAADGTGDDDLIGSVPGQITLPWAWSIDGKKLVTMNYVFEAGWNIGSFSMEGDHTHKSILQKEYFVISPKISPNGKWMAYTSSASDDLEICVRPFPDVDSGGNWQISTDGGDGPLWSPDGRELFYRKDGEVIAVKVETEPTFKYGKREILFSGNYVANYPGDNHTWDIHPDGDRFLMMKPVEGSVDSSETVFPRKIIIVVNWFEELKERVPTE